MPVAICIFYVALQPHDKIYSFIPESRIIIFTIKYSRKCVLFIQFHCLQAVIDLSFIYMIDELLQCTDYLHCTLASSNNPNFTLTKNIATKQKCMQRRCNNIIYNELHRRQNILNDFNSSEYQKALHLKNRERSERSLLS